MTTAVVTPPVAAAGRSGFTWGLFVLIWLLPFHAVVVAGLAGGNPNGRLNYTDDTGWDGYNGLQVQFRQRLSQGLTWNVNWTWSKSLTNLPADNQNQSVDFLTLRNFETTNRESLFDRYRSRSLLRNCGSVGGVE